jgi:muconolactone delta-isomerase
MMKLQPITNTKRFAVWRINGEWQVQNVTELESYEQTTTVRQGWEVPIYTDDKQRVMLIDRENGDQHYVLFYLGDYEAPQLVPISDYLMFGSREFQKFDETLVYPAMEAVKAHEKQLREKGEAERKFKEIQVQLGADYAKREYRIMQAQTRALLELEEWYEDAIAQARRDLGLPPENSVSE